MPNVPATWTACRFTASSLTLHRNCVIAIFSQSLDANPDWHQTLQSSPWPERTSAPNSWSRLAVQDNYQRLAYTSYMRQFRFERTAQRASLAIARLLRVTRPPRCQNSLKMFGHRTIRLTRGPRASEVATLRRGKALFTFETSTAAKSVAIPPLHLVELTNSIVADANTRTSVQVATYDARAKGL